MKNFVRSSLSVLLVLAMLLAIPAFAVGMNDTDNINKETNSSANILTEELYTEEIELTPSDTAISSDDVYEITSLRERNVKHIYMGDGKYTAIVYGNDVHRINEKGELVDIDNRLTLKGDTYKTSDGRLSFDKSIASFNISENGYSIKMSLISAAGAQRKAPAIANHAERLSPSKNLSRDEKINTLKAVDNKTEIVYNDVMSGTDIEYILNSNDIKENIIIKGEQDSYSYRFTLELEGLTPALNADGSISIYDSDIDVLVYTIPAPYMYDANGVYSYDAHYTLIGGTNGRYTLTVTADEDFVNAPDRAFPVTLDPTIVSQYSGYITEDTYISFANENTNYGSASELLVGNGKIALVKFGLPTLPSGSYVRSAYLSLPYHFDGESYGELYINAYRITDTWGESTATWSSTNEDIDTTLLGSGYTYSEYTVTATSPAWTNVYITDAVNSWVSGASANYGIALSAGSGDREPVKILSRESTNVLTVLSVSIEYEFSLADGVYAIKNMGNSYAYMSVSGSSTSTGVSMLAKNHSTNPVNNFSREALFKISRKASTGTYIIRLMTNNSLSIAFSGTSVVTKTIPTNDASVSVSDTFYIEEIGNAFYIIPYSSTGYVIGAGTMSGTSTSLTKTAKSSATTTSRWTFTPYTGRDIESVDMISSKSSIYCGATFDFDAVVYSTVIGENGPITYSVKNINGTSTDKATINSSTGVLSAQKKGTVKVGVTYSGAPEIWWWTVEITPAFVGELIDNGYASSLDIESTDDGFYMLTKSLADILLDANITTIAVNSGGTDLRVVANYYDDWYIYAVESNEECSYGMLKMREPENDGIDGDDTGITISFVGLSYDKLLTLINSNTVTNSYALFQNLEDVTGPGIADYDDVIVNYFARVESKAPYLIADQFIYFIVETTCVNGIIPAPPTYLDVLEEIDEIETLIRNPLLDSDAILALYNTKAKLQRIPNALVANNSAAGYSVYNTANNTICISNPNSLSIYEEYAILSTHTANVTFNSFAAEVQFHADALYDWLANLPQYYEKALRADMAVGEEYNSGLFDEYYDLNSSIVQAQAAEHGEH